MVKDAQVWLNSTYGNNSHYTRIEENGITGNIVMEALVTALQIDLGITNPTGYFGPTTESEYSKKMIKKGDRDSDKNLVKILQYGLYCKGYNPTGVSGYYGDGTEAAVEKVQSDAGYDESMITNTITAKLFREILCSDALVLVANGDKKIRTIQQLLNRNYGSWFDIIPCDGMYGAKTEKALIYAFQKEGGLSSTVANGNFGPATENIAQNNPLSMGGNNNSSFVKLAKYALYCNGERRNSANVFDCSDNGEFSGEFTNKMHSVVTAFQNFTGMLEVTGKVEKKEWMSLLVSTGYSFRNVLACDTSTQLTETKAKRIVANDFTIVGRYLTGSTTKAPKYLTREELNMLFSKNLSVFVIYQDEKEYYKENPEETTTVNYYRYSQGYADAKKACEVAEALGIKYGEVIFFSVDYDFNDKQTTEKILPHFKGISSYIRSHGSKYTVGIYGPRNICRRVSDNAYAKWSFVSDMSTGFSGNLGFALPENWVFDQIREYLQGAADGGFNLDCVASSGKYTGITEILPENVVNPPISSDKLCVNYYSNILQSLGLSLDSIGVDVPEFTGTYAFPLPFGEVRVEARKGTSLSIGKEYKTSKLNIQDGECMSANYEKSVQITKELTYDASLGLSTDGIMDLTNKVKYAINNGYVESGVSVSSDGTIKLSYLLHKDASEEEGIDDYIDILIKLTFSEKLTPEQQRVYNDAVEMVEEAQENNTDINIDWNAVFHDALAIVFVGAVFLGVVLVISVVVQFIVTVAELLLLIA